MNGAQVKRGARSSGKRRLGQNGQRRGQRGDRVRRARVGKAVAAGSSDGDPKAAAAQGLRHGRVGARSIEHNVRRDPAGQRPLVVEVAHPAQVAFAFLAHIAQETSDAASSALAWTSAWAMASIPASPAPFVAGSGSLQAVAVHYGFNAVPTGNTVSR